MRKRHRYRVTLVIPDFDKWSDADAATWELKHSGTPNTDCQPSFTSVAGKVKHGTFSADECKTSLTENADGITLDYEFKIQVSASGSPTFPYDHEYTMYVCQGKTGSSGQLPNSTFSH